MYKRCSPVYGSPEADFGSFEINLLNIEADTDSKFELNNLNAIPKGRRDQHRKPYSSGSIRIRVQRTLICIRLSSEGALPFASWQKITGDAPCSPISNTLREFFQ